MPITNPAKGLGRRSLGHRAGAWRRGPEATFAATVLTAFAASAACMVMLQSDLVLPVISTLFFVMASMVALLAWRWEHAGEQNHITYWDVAGALTLFGICVASQVDPDQMVRLVEGARRDH
jgi:hypothetical protein